MKMTSFQKKIINDIDWKNCAPIVNLNKITRGFGISVKTIKNQGFYIDPQLSFIGNLGEKEVFTRFLMKNMGEEPIQELRFFQSRRKRERMESSLKYLERICPYMYSEYDRDGRISWPQVKEAMEMAGLEISPEFEKICQSRRNDIYDDTCGIFGGHHSYVTWSTKGFILYEYIEREMNRKEWVEI